MDSSVGSANRTRNNCSFPMFQEDLQGSLPSFQDSMQPGKDVNLTVDMSTVWNVGHFIASCPSSSPRSCPCIVFPWFIRIGTVITQQRMQSCVWLNQLFQTKLKLSSWQSNGPPWGSSELSHVAKNCGSFVWQSSVPSDGRTCHSCPILAQPFNTVTASSLAKRNLPQHWNCQAI